MAKMSRDKGRRGELEVVSIFVAQGLSCWRTPNSGALHHSPGDVRGIPGLHIEVKRCESLKMDHWSRQAEGDCTSTDVPLVIYRRSAEPWRVSMLLEDWIPMFKASRS